MVHLSKDQVASNAHQQYDPNCYDFRWNADFTEVTVVPLLWSDDASYAAYQGDPCIYAQDGDPEYDAMVRESTPDGNPNVNHAPKYGRDEEIPF